MYVCMYGTIINDIWKNLLNIKRTSREYKENIQEKIYQESNNKNHKREREKNFTNDDKWKRMRCKL